jgi:hypothetical protein
VNDINIVYVARPSEPTDFGDQTLEQQIVARIAADSAEQAVFILVPTREPIIVRFH